MSNIIHDNKREEDLQVLCNTILTITSDSEVTNDGSYVSSCPFCNAEEYRLPSDRKHWVNMDGLKHSNNCPYLIAKDLSTNIK